MPATEDLREAEIVRVFKAAHSFGSRYAPLRGIMAHTMLALAYCAGLRIGEIAALTLRDVDADCGIIEIRETKFFKTRQLPLATRVCAELSSYLAAREKTGAPTGPDAPFWWTPQRRKGYAYGQLERLLTRVIRRAGLKPARGREGPRVHDLRHAFVAHRMLNWYREGVEPQSRLPHLATYLGHKDIVSTLVYLNITPTSSSLRSPSVGPIAIDAVASKFTKPTTRATAPHHAPYEPSCHHLRTTELSITFTSAMRPK